MSIIPAPGAAKNSATRNETGRVCEGPESVFYCHKSGPHAPPMMSFHITMAAHLEWSIA